MQPRNWEEYTLGPNAAGANRAYVTINARCVILLNKKAYADLGSPAYASLFYDADNQTIGILPASSTARRPFPFKKNSTSYLLNTKSFCRHHDIIPASAVSFVEARIDNDGILCLNLNEVVPVVSKGKKRAVSSDK